MGLGLVKRTPAIPVGKSLKLTVTLKTGTYHFWDPVRSTMARAVYLTVKGKSTTTPSGSGSTGSGSTYTPPPPPASGSGTPTMPMDPGMDGCNH
jgi:hypothetical protein